jgi:hypothetical protein
MRFEPVDIGVIGSAFQKIPREVVFPHSCPGLDERPAWLRGGGCPIIEIGFEGAVGTWVDVERKRISCQFADILLEFSHRKNDGSSYGEGREVEESIPVLN